MKFDRSNAKTLLTAFFWLYVIVAPTVGFVLGVSDSHAIGRVLGNLVIAFLGLGVLYIFLAILRAILDSADYLEKIAATGTVVAHSHKLTNPSATTGVQNKKTLDQLLGEAGQKP